MKDNCESQFNTFIFKLGILILILRKKKKKRKIQIFKFLSKLAYTNTDFLCKKKKKKKVMIIIMSY
jgi:hypothetical protein